MQAAQVVELWLQNRGGLKTLAFSDKIGNKAAVFSLSCESLKYKPVLTSLFASSGVHAAAVKLNIRPTLLLVMAYELLFGHGKIEGGGAVKRFLKENESKLRSSLARLKVDKAVANDQDLLPPAARSTTGNNLPRYVRVNTLVSTVPDAIALLVSEGFTFLQHATVPRFGNSVLNVCRYSCSHSCFNHLQ
jgi:putative methyltransferase